MSTDAKKAVENATETTDKPEADKPKRKRRVHRLGVSMALSEYPVPDSGLDSVPSDWDIQSHKELRAEEFSDVLNYFEWLQQYAASLAEAAKAKATELAAYGDADTRKEMSELFGGTEQLASMIAAATKKEGMSPEQKAAAAARIKEILGDALGG